MVDFILPSSFDPRKRRMLASRARITALDVIATDRGPAITTTAVMSCSGILMQDSQYRLKAVRLDPGSLQSNGVLYRKGKRDKVAQAASTRAPGVPWTRKFCMGRFFSGRFDLHLSRAVQNAMSITLSSPGSELSRREVAIEGRKGDLKGRGNILRGCTSHHQLTGGLKLGLGHNGWTATFSATTTGSFETGSRPLPYEVEFELAHRSHHVKDQTPTRRGRIDLLR